jgi:hypothetical protein
MKLLNFTFILLCLGSAPTIYANELLPKKCPSVGAIQATHFLVEKEPGDTQFYLIQDNQPYDTDITEGSWTVTLWPIIATSIDDAMQKGKAALSTLSFQQGPIKNYWFGKPGCTYVTSVGYKVDAIFYPTR